MFLVYIIVCIGTWWVVSNALKTDLGIGSKDPLPRRSRIISILAAASIPIFITNLLAIIFVGIPVLLS